MAGRDPRPRAGMSYIPWWKSSHRGLQPAERTTRIDADDAGCGPGLAAGRRRQDAGRRGTGGQTGKSVGRRVTSHPSSRSLRGVQQTLLRLSGLLLFMSQLGWTRPQTLALQTSHPILPPMIQQRQLSRRCAAEQPAWALPVVYGMRSKHCFTARISGLH